MTSQLSTNSQWYIFIVPGGMLVIESIQRESTLSGCLVVTSQPIYAPVNVKCGWSLTATYKPLLMYLMQPPRVPIPSYALSPELLVAFLEVKLTGSSQIVP